MKFLGISRNTTVGRTIVKRIKRKNHPESSVDEKNEDGNDDDVVHIDESDADESKMK